jgi:hypothetical protein
MAQSIPELLFDKRDYELLNIVNDVLSRDKSQASLKRLLDPYLHPHGIKEMAASQSLRIAYAVINLLDSMDVGRAPDRISALRSLRDEVVHIVHGSFRNNTARVLLEIMKELVRSHGNYRRQLELAHDFRTATTGKPRIIRRMLKRYHLLEMPEEWKQVAFDDHVHDVHTKGRKSATHLIMDAWIKGIRHLTVIYYNYVRMEAVKELLEAAEIMGITARVGIELSARFRNRFVHMIWLPRGFPDVKDFLHLLQEPSVAEFLAESRKVSDYQQQYVMSVLQAFNQQHRHTINQTYGVDIEPLDLSDFESFVGTGQASLLHLGRFIHMHLAPAMQIRINALRDNFCHGSADEKSQMRRAVEEMNELGLEAIVSRFLRPEANPTIPNPGIPQDSGEEPELLRLSPAELTERLNQLHSGYRITLNLSSLRVQDVLELLYDCKGRITHLEIFNLKDHTTGEAPEYAEICELQHAINQENVIALKRVIQGIITRLESSTPGEESAEADRIDKLKQILRNIPALQSYYKVAPLRSKIGSDSTGRARHLHGMGLVVVETLPFKAQKEIERTVGRTRQIVPVQMAASLQKTYVPRGSSAGLGAIFRLIRRLPGCREFGCTCQQEWVVERYSRYAANGEGNVATLGGIAGRDSELSIDCSDVQSNARKFSYKYLNTGIKIGCKIALGFIPAFATFFLTKDWWFLAYFGAFIWFGITGLRNIMQSVLGGGGLRRSPLLRWNNYISWERVADSLLFTGFSVPLLEYIVKTVILDSYLGITTATNPTVLYAVMALANGVYLSSHNAFRGLPRGAVLGNFFRSILSIPLALIINVAAGALLGFSGIQDVSGMLQKWAAIISKTASDCVAGVIEGLVDRRVNIRIRLNDYRTKIKQMFDTYAQLELLFPEANVLEMLESPQQLIKRISTGARDLEKVISINALDIFYLWMYQPRGRSAFRMLIRSMSNEEQQILVRSQKVLQRQREISQLFIDGLIGKKFSKALSLYLDRSEEYLQAINKLTSEGVVVEIRAESDSTGAADEESAVASPLPTDRVGTENVEAPLR